jgi:hypothetical protein
MSFDYPDGLTTPELAAATSSTMASTGISSDEIDTRALAQAALDLPEHPQLPQEQTDAIVTDLQQAVEAMVAMTDEVTQDLVEIMRAATKAVAPLFRAVYDAYLKVMCDRPRWWHLYKHSKRLRTRRKYEHRLRQMAMDYLVDAAGPEHRGR